MLKYIPTSETLVTDWPYGRLRAEAHLSVEFSPKNGFRSVFQSKNPKTNRWNAPKKSTYSPCVVRTIDETGYISSVHHSFNGGNEINEGVKFMAENFHLFTAPQIAYIYTHVAAAIKVHHLSMVQYSGADSKEVFKVIEPAFKATLEGIKTGENTFERILLDLPALEALRVPNYNPWKVTERFAIS